MKVESYLRLSRFYMGIVFLGIAAVFALFTYRIGYQAGWHWGASLACAAIPIVFTIFLGILGVLIGAMFVTALWKAN